MQLNENILQAQKLWADKELKFWMIVCDTSRWQTTYHRCISRTVKENWEFNVGCDWYEIYDLCYINIIGSPIDYSRLCYLMEISRTGKIHRDMFDEIVRIFNNNPELYNQTILEWDEKTVNLVRDFILSIQSDANT